MSIFISEDKSYKSKKRKRYDWWFECVQEEIHNKDR